MPDFLKNIFSTDTFMPHGYCLRWDPFLVSVWNAANIGIALAYFAIPIALLYFVRKRKDLAYSWIFRMFGAFIVACGLTHVLKVWTIYHGDYWMEASVDAWTAIISIATAVALWPLIPRALALRSPAELESANKLLQEQIVAREKSEADLKGSEDALRRRSEELASTNLELELSRDSAVSASNVKSAFVANISHELRTPLSAILGMNELLLSTELSEEQHNYATKLQQAGKSLLTIVNDLLDLSKIESGKMELDSVQSNLHALIKDSVQLLQEAARNKGLTLTLVLEEAVPQHVLVDPVRLRRVLLNLIGNAIKFTHEGKISVVCQLISSSAAAAQVKLSVSDTGIGIAPDKLKLLFRPFSQVDSSTTRGYEGTGLGLSISKHLVELMGGEIGVESTRGKGSTFWFSLPLRVSSGQMVSTDSSEAVGQAITELEGQQLVLVVEDNPVLTEIAVKQLEILGIAAHAVATAEEALSKIAAHDYKLVLMDCHLPQMDGFEATRLIREAERAGRSRVPIVAMTAGAMKGDEERCLESGMDDYLSKPYTLNELRNKVRRWLAAK